MAEHPRGDRVCCDGVGQGITLDRAQVGVEFRAFGLLKNAETIQPIDEVGVRVSQQLFGKPFRVGQIIAAQAIADQPAQRHRADLRTAAQSLKSGARRRRNGLVAGG
jgi:hypothetical protein